MAALKEQLHEHEEKIRRTGCYTEGLPLAESDSIKFEIFHSKLLSAVVNARETALRVSVTGEGENVMGLYTREGDLVVHSTGIIAHVRTMSRCIKWMIEHDFEEEMGFSDGDYFINNDPHVGGLHVPDVMLITPLYYDGAIVGWVGGVTHVQEVGAVEPGSMPVSAVTRFHEGLVITPMKVVEGHKMRRDYEILIERRMRSPLHWLLDDKAKLAGCRIIMDQVRSIIAEYGLDYYQEATREIIEDGRRRVMAKVRQVCFPGRYRSASLYDVLFEGKQGIPAGAARDSLMHFPLEMTVTRDGRLILDFEGASSWGLHPQNVCEAGMEGGYSICLTQLLAYEGKINEGTLMGSELRLPVGSWANPDYLFAATATAWRALIAAYGNFYRTLAYAEYARGYREEIFSSPANLGTVQVGGVDQYGRRYGGTLGGITGASGSGARGVMDGIDAGYRLWEPTTDLHNMEHYELIYSPIFFGERIIPDTGGLGRFRGGNSVDSLILIAFPGATEMGAHGFGYKVLDQPGIMGAYPGSGRYLHIARGTNMKELIESGQPLPHDEGGDPASPLIKTMVKAQSYEIGMDTGYPARPIGQYDLWEVIGAAGGGFGDPIDRDPELVRRDLELGWTLLRTAKRVYGVVLDESGAIDAGATRRRRQEILRERRDRAIPARKYLDRERQRVHERRVHPVLRDLYNDVFRLSERWAGDFRAYWGLPEGWTF